ncbi:VanW family protein [Anaerocolumna aminovalerica]|uniref:Vancomycin resistance protein YoaR, contains peptidoglycan-binding and VanW domains n=1 Tax=Anaerocolumna aminovalerica TaxID=1527 RepID=A0A1I5IT52_9FIRM|nr:VanW family protein [Anaerocolumna aminovalerica]SFO63745.1 Vancomycin resistance protein YoaR, contains peptidoglycan-binding and VanW domains [Anaerocolumna aminovalerica]
MKKKTAYKIMLFAICLFSTMIVSKVSAAEEDEAITQGIYIDSVHIGGMTETQAREAVQDYINNLKSKTVTVQIEDKSETVSLDDLAYSEGKNDFIEQAIKIGKEGNLIKRYKDLKDVEVNKLVYDLAFTIDDNKLKEFLETKCSVYDVEPLNATVKRENGTFVYTNEVVGKKLEVQDTLSDIKNALSDNWNQENIVVTGKVVEVSPKYTREMVNRVNAVLGSFSTTYTSSSADRAGNLANGARLINNTILYPGDEFSAYEKLTPFTPQNGYYAAGSYLNGKVVDSIGGGACQVTTTLYNAVLDSELEVTERAAHSMTIGYVPLSRDAAIAGTWKNLKFKNNTNAPVLIQAFTQGRTITFTIWGEETRNTANRRVKYETVILSETKPGPDVVTKDPTKPTTYEVTTQSAHIGYVAELYKVVYENGIEVSRTRVNKSYYSASPRYVTIGTMEVEEEVPKDEDGEKDKEEGKKPSKNKPSKNKPSGENKKDDDTNVTNPDEINVGDNTQPEDAEPIDQSDASGND